MFSLVWEKHSKLGKAGIGVDTAGSIWDEMSCDEIQDMMNQMLGSNTFSFSDYVAQMIQGKLPFSLQSFVETIFHGFAANLTQERKMYVYLILIAVVGAVLSNFPAFFRGSRWQRLLFMRFISCFFLCC